MREFFARLFKSGSDSEESNDDAGVSSNEDLPEPESTRGPDDWEWERAAEFQYDHYTEALPDVTQLKRDQEHEAVEELLL